jgi:hypothetical protein
MTKTRSETYSKNPAAPLTFAAGHDLSLHGAGIGNLGEMVQFPGFQTTQATEMGGIIRALKGQLRARWNFRPAEIAEQGNTLVFLRAGANRRTGAGQVFHHASPSDTYLLILGTISGIWENSIDAVFSS